MVCFSYYAYSQKWQVIDKLTYEPIPYATITFSNEGFKYQCLTNSEGQIDSLIKLPKNQKLILQIFAYGYRAYADTVVFPSFDRTLFLEPLTYDLHETVITGEFFPVQKEQSLYPVKIISHEVIQRMGAQNLREIFSNQINIRLGQDAILATTMKMLGLSGQQVKIMVDGVPVIGRLNGNIDLSQINSLNIQKIEIVEGPMAVQYGTDAIGGVINIITKKTAEDTLVVKPLFYYESNGTYNSQLSMQAQISKHHLNIHLGRNFFDGWLPSEPNFFIEKTRMADTSRYKVWKPKEQFMGSAAFFTSLNKWKLSFFSDYFQELIQDKGKPAAPYFETAIDHKYKTWRNNQNIQIELPQKWNFVAGRSYYKRMKNSFFNDLTSLQQHLTTNSGDQDTSTYQMILSRAVFFQTIFDNPLELGYDTYTEQAISSIIFNKTQRIWDFAAFMAYSLNFKNRFKIKPALRFSYNSTYKTPLIPSLHSSLTIYQKHTDSTRASLITKFSYSKGFRTPSLKELYLAFNDMNHHIVGNPELKPELSHYFHYTFAYDWVTPKHALDASFASFYNHVYNIIQLAFVNANTNQYSYINIEKLNTMGANLNIKHSYLNLTHSITFAYNAIQYPSSINSKPLFYPEWVYNFSFSFKKIRTQWNIFAKYNGKLPYFTTNGTDGYQLNIAEDYAQVDLTVSTSLWGERINLLGGIKNLLNYTFLNLSTGGAHASGGSFISTGRTFFLQCSLNLKK